MSNMSYCRFENTANDLDDCLDHIYDSTDDMSEYEIRGREKLIELCQQIAEIADEENFNS